MSLFEKRNVAWMVMLLLFIVPGWSKEPSFNVPLHHPVYYFLDMLPFPGITDGVSLSSRPFSESQICTLLAYAKREFKPVDTIILNTYLLEFAGTKEAETGSPKFFDVSIDGNKTHAYPFLTTDFRAQDSGFTVPGFDAIYVDSLSTSVEGYNKTAVGGRLYSDVNGFLSYFEGAILTEYGSQENWVKINDPHLGRNYATIMAARDKPGHLIGYDDYTAYIKIPLSWCNLLVGNENVSWGYAGTSGLLLSGAGKPFLQATASKTIGKLDYTMIVGKLTADTYDQNRVVYAKHMTFAPTDWIAVGLSDAVITINRSIEPSYFLPFVPFYFVEHAVSTHDNRIMSFDANVNVQKLASVYGELLIDETSSILGFVTNHDANDRWGGLLGVKWHNPVKSLPVSLLKAEVVQIEPWVYTTSSHSGENLFNYPINFGQPLGSALGPHARKLSLDFSCFISTKTRGRFSVSQYWKGRGPDSAVTAGSNIFSDNGMVVDTVDGIAVGRQLFEKKDFRFQKYSRDRTVISAVYSYFYKNWFQAEAYGDVVFENKPQSGTYFRCGVETRLNY